MHKSGKKLESVTKIKWKIKQNRWVKNSKGKKTN
jgi:hypothetical protein